VSNRIALGREAMRAALQLRRSMSLAREEPVSVYDLATNLGVDVIFLDRPSLEGMFVRDPDPVVLLPSRRHRPAGRISFSCAHELGHFQLGHGTKVDEYIEGDSEPHFRSEEEIAANTFASSLLMPRQAVLQRFAVRDFRPVEADPLVLFAIAGELGVGYSTLTKHLYYGLELVTEPWLVERRRTSPKRIREQILGSSEGKRVLVVDEHWPQLPIDLEVGDFLAIPTGTSMQFSPILAQMRTSASWQILIASHRGVGRLRVGLGNHLVRIASAGYCGQLKYRLLDDPEAE